MDNHDNYSDLDHKLDFKGNLSIIVFENQSNQANNIINTQNQ